MQSSGEGHDVTHILLIDGSPRANSNTRSIVTYLGERLEDLGAHVDHFRVTAQGPSDEDLERLLCAARHYEALVLAAPLYFDGLPAVTQAFLERVHDMLTLRRMAADAATAADRESAEQAGHRGRRRGAMPAAATAAAHQSAADEGCAAGTPLYGVVHSGFVEPAQRRPAVWTLELFARAVGWPWRGAMSFGGTSPIGGRPLDEVGRLAAVVREGLALGARDIMAGRPLSAATLAACARSPFAMMPRRAVIWLINARTRQYVRKRGIEVGALPYADQS